MMWIDGVSPLEVVEPTSPRRSRSSSSASRRQPTARAFADRVGTAEGHSHRLGARAHRRRDPPDRDRRHVAINVKYPIRRPVPVHRTRCLGSAARVRPASPTGVGRAAGRLQGLGVPAVAGARGIDDAVHKLPTRRGRWRWTGIRVGGVRYIPLTAAGAAPGRIRLGFLAYRCASAAR